MVADIVLALIIFYWGIPLAMAALVWIVLQAFEHPWKFVGWCAAAWVLWVIVWYSH